MFHAPYWVPARRSHHPDSLLRADGHPPRSSWHCCIGSLLLRAPLVQVWVIALLAMFPAVLIPWERLRATLLSVQRSLAGVVGDSYVFLVDFVQWRAILRVRREGEWMSQRARRVIVVAHSQGAAVANLAINRPLECMANGGRPSSRRGAGVCVLERLEHSSEDSAVMAAGWMRGGRRNPALVRHHGAHILWQAVRGVVVLAGVIALLYFGWLAARGGPTLPASPFGAASTKPWVDFFATDDPVPHGTLGTIHHSCINRTMCAIVAPVRPITRAIGRTAAANKPSCRVTAKHDYEWPGATRSAENSPSVQQEVVSAKG
jgi:hypothetical protein